MDWLLVATAIKFVTAVGSVSIEKNNSKWWCAVRKLHSSHNVKLTNCYRPMCCHLAGSLNVTFYIECINCHQVVSIRKAILNHILLLTSVNPLRTWWCTLSSCQRVGWCLISWIIEHVVEGSIAQRWWGPSDLDSYSIVIVIVPWWNDHQIGDCLWSCSENKA